jgi:dihydrofolate reductase
MPIRGSVYIATSLDGYIARANGDLDWLPGANGTPTDEDYGYHAFMETVDVIVMGRHTYEKVLSFDGWPYPDHKVVVLSSRDLPIPAEASVERLALDPPQVAAYLAAQELTHMYVDGGNTIQRFLNARLIDELIITTVPVLIGDGIRLFGAVDHDIKLEHVETRQFPSGLVQSRYHVPQKL